MKKTCIFVLLLLALLMGVLTACGQNSGDPAATGPSRREGYTYEGPDLIRYNGQLYQYRAVAIRVPEGMRYVGTIERTVDGVPETDLACARDLDPGTRLYLLPDTDTYLFPCAAGEEPPQAGELWWYGYSLQDFPAEEPAPECLYPYLSPGEGEK